MKEESAPSSTRYVFSPDPGDRFWLVFSLFACALFGVWLVVTGFATTQFVRILPGLYILGLLYPLGMAVRARSGRITIFDDRIEQTGPTLHGTILFDGSESIVPVRGGYTLCQGATCIRVYRRHPKFARIEQLLLERSRVFRDARTPTVPFTLRSRPFVSTITSSFWALWAIFILSADIDAGHHLFALSLLAIGCIAMAIPTGRSVFRVEYRFEPDAIVVKTKKRELSFLPRNVEFTQRYGRQTLSVAPMTGRATTIYQDDVVMPLKGLKTLLDRSYGLGEMGSMRGMRSMKYSLRRSGQR